MFLEIPVEDSFTPVNGQKMFRRKIRKLNFINNSTVKKILVMMNPE